MYAFSQSRPQVAKTSKLPNNRKKRVVEEEEEEEADSSSSEDDGDDDSYKEEIESVPPPQKKRQKVAEAKPVVPSSVVRPPPPPVAPKASPIPVAPPVIPAKASTPAVIPPQVITPRASFHTSTSTPNAVVNNAPAATAAPSEPSIIRVVFLNVLEHPAPCANYQNVCFDSEETHSDATSLTYYLASFQANCQSVWCCAHSTSAPDSPPLLQNMLKKPTSYVAELCRLCSPQVSVDLVVYVKGSKIPESSAGSPVIESQKSLNRISLTVLADRTEPGREEGPCFSFFFSQFNLLSQVLPSALRFSLLWMNSVAFLLPTKTATSCGSIARLRVVGIVQLVACTCQLSLRVCMRL